MRKSIVDIFRTHLKTEYLVDFTEYIDDSNSTYDMFLDDIVMCAMDVATPLNFGVIIELHKEGNWWLPLKQFYVCDYHSRKNDCVSWELLRDDIRIFVDTYVRKGIHEISVLVSPDYREVTPPGYE